MKSQTQIEEKDEAIEEIRGKLTDNYHQAMAKLNASNMERTAASSRNVCLEADLALLQQKLAVCSLSIREATEYSSAVRRAARGR
jgi:hypothetical protein